MAEAKSLLGKYRFLVGNTVFRFLVVGGFAYVVEMGSLFLLKHGGLSSLGAVAISFWVGLIVSFTLQKFVAFKDNRRHKHIIIKQSAVYLALVVFNYLFTLFLVKSLQSHINVYSTRTIAVVITTTWSFVVYKKMFRTDTFRT